MTSTAILIPARYNSTRLPGKPLVRLDGVPMIKRVYDACTASNLPTYVLTDDMRIYELFGSDKCFIEQKDYANGTERCAGAITHDFFSQYDQFINVQGDMPDVTVEMINQCQWHLQYYQVTTLWTDMPNKQQNDSNTVKLIKAGDRVLWCGRGISGYGNWHLGVYGYTRDALEMYPNLIIEKEETIEQLEQLRWLKNGWQVGCTSVQYNGVEINSPEDVETWHSKYSQ